MNIFKFTDFDSFYRNYVPMTPYGKSDKAERKLHTSMEYLNKTYDLIERFMEKLLNKTATVASIEYHLKRIPKLDFLDNPCYSPTDIFLIKKFLFNYKQISEKIPPEFNDLFFIKFNLFGLLNKLDLNDGKETFFLSEKYSDKLKKIRSKIKRLDRKLSAMKKERLEFIKNEFNLDFRFQDFIVIEESKVLGIDDQFVYKEGYDSKNVVIKPVLQKEYFLLHSEKEALVAAEKEEENKIILSLTADIKSEVNNIKDYVTVIHKFDVTLAKAVLAKKFSMTRPILSGYGDNIEICSGRCVPVMDNCAEIGTKYYPLDAVFNNRNIVVSGSNMGGKTVVLKTIAFLQLLTQMGFYVPAVKYKTIVFDNLHYVGDLNHKHSAGLSSYGIEIYEFIKSTEKSSDNSLLIIDEFAGTTNSIEAEALISAILISFCKKKSIYSFLSTHFMNLPELKNLSFYRMKGLDSDKYEKYYRAKTNFEFIERIKLINSFMVYEIEHDLERKKSYDALKVAEILGLNEDIIADAKKIIEADKITVSQLSHRRGGDNE